MWFKSEPIRPIDSRAGRLPARFDLLIAALLYVCTTTLLLAGAPAAVRRWQRQQLGVVGVTMMAQGPVELDEKQREPKVTWMDRLFNRLKSSSITQPAIIYTDTSHHPPAHATPLGRQVTSGASRDVGQGAVISAVEAGAFAYSTAEERRAASTPEGGAWSEGVTPCERCIFY